MRFSLSLIPVVLLSTLSLSAQRLDPTVRPEHYTLHFAPNLQAATFTGEETIDLHIEKPSNTITLNAIELKIGSVKATAGSVSAVGSVSYDEEKEQATFTFPQSLPAGKVKLDVAFTGILNSKLRGFYLSKTSKRNYAVTQFESTDARRAFPSFDEPALKATFDVSLTVDKGDTVIANGPVVKDVPVGDAKHRMTFATTPKMSTYLVAFQVGDFKCTEGKSDGIPIRACATPENVKLTKFAVTAAEHFLHYYNSYFGIKYPMPKLDMIGIPDFEAGAMENFGCITYRETDLLVDPKTAPLAAQKRVAVVVAHEMAHQWFGDMVTMQWWDNVWLNEGFANWMESKAVGEWKPEWKMRDDEAQTLNDTLATDSSSTTHAIRATADTPAQIEEMFDGISYGKGGSVIGMVEHYLGDEIFRKGVHNYLAAHMYGNATAEDFWNAQTKTSGKPVDAIMSSFVEQVGAPLLQFSEVKDGKTTVSQKRFVVSGTANTNQSWTVPVCFRNSACQIVTAANPVVKVPAGVAYGNADYKGYYRSNYASKDVESLLENVSVLSSPERIGLAGDRWALVRANEGSIGEYMNLVSKLHADTNVSVLDTALGNVSYVRSRLATPQQYEKLNQWILREFGPEYAAVRAERKTDSEELRQRRALLFSVLGSAGDKNVRSDAKEIANRFLNGDTTVDPEIAATALGIASMDGTDADYDRVLQWGKAATTPRNRSIGLSVLTRFERPELVKRTLEYAVGGEVKNQDNWILISSLLGNPRTRELTWTWMKENWQKIDATLTVSSGQRIVGATSNFCSVERADEVKQFFAEHPVKASERTQRSVQNSIRSCAALRASQGPKLDAWLSMNVR